jgi:hypothetical protein
MLLVLRPTAHSHASLACRRLVAQGTSGARAQSVSEESLSRTYAVEMIAHFRVAKVSLA